MIRRRWRCGSSCKKSHLSHETFLALLLAPVSLHAAAKPDVIDTLAGDLVIGDLSCYGSDHYKSPNIDKFAVTGTRFTQAFTGALCGPSCALIITGRYPFRNGSSNQDARMRMPNAELQLGRVFKSALYKTGETPPSAAVDPKTAGCAAKFDKIDKPKTGKLTREYYTTHQSDAEAAATRFEKMDVDKDGIVTRDEYIANGGKKLKTK